LTDRASIRGFGEEREGRGLPLDERSLLPNSMGTAEHRLFPTATEAKKALGSLLPNVSLPQATKKAPKKPKK